MIGADHGDAREEETAIQLFQREVGRNKDSKAELRSARKPSLRTFSKLASNTGNRTEKEERYDRYSQNKATNEPPGCAGGGYRGKPLPMNRQVSQQKQYDYIGCPQMNLRPEMKRVA